MYLSTLEVLPIHMKEKCESPVRREVQGPEDSITMCLLSGAAAY